MEIVLALNDFTCIKVVPWANDFSGAQD